MSRPHRPPRLPARLARWFLTPVQADRLLDALDEEYAIHQSVQRSRVGADLWYWRQVLRSLPPLLRLAWERRHRPLLVDLRHLQRKVRRSPVSAGAAVLTLSLALGAGTSILAVVDAVLLEGPPFADPQALFTLGEADPRDRAGLLRPVGHATFEAWRRRAGPLAVLEAFDPTNLTLTGLGAAERVSVTNVTPGFLALLGVTPALGRSLHEGDDGLPVVVVGHAFWSGMLGADPGAVGRRLVLGGEPHTIVGVLPEDFFFALNPSALWRPLPPTPARTAEGDGPVRVLARLADPGSSDRLVRALSDVVPTAAPSRRVAATPLSAAVAGDSERVLALLAGAAILAMVVAFINLAGLLLVRSMDRRRELAVRRALGAPASETTRQLVLEAVGLAAVGILGGLLLASWLTPVVGRLALEFGGLAQRDMTVGWRVAGVVGLLALACAGVCGAVPGLGVGRATIVDALRDGATRPRGELGLRRMLVAGEVALAFVLLVSMALLGRSLLTVLTLDPGFEPHGVLKLQVSLPASSYGSAERVASFHSSLRDALERRLGTGTVSMVDELPLTGDGGRGLVRVRPTEAGHEGVVRSASPGYFEVMGIPVVAGRPFGPEDDRVVPPRVVLTTSLAEGLFPSEAAVGRRVWLEGTGEAEVVGVAGDVKHRALELPARPTVYRSALQFPSASTVLVVRSGRPDAAVVAAVREEVGRLDAEVPVYGIRSMRDVVGTSPGVPARRLLTAAFAGFALLAAVLSAIGLFGVAAHDVARRRAELALRRALGAGRLRILKATVGPSTRMVASGLAVGGVLSVVAVRGLASVLVTGRWDVLAVGAGVTVLLLATAGAAVLPAALRAAGSEPVTALRLE